MSTNPIEASLLIRDRLEGCLSLFSTDGNSHREQLDDCRQAIVIGKGLQKNGYLFRLGNKGLSLGLQCFFRPGRRVVGVRKSLAKSFYCPPIVDGRPRPTIHAPTLKGIANCLDCEVCLRQGP